MRLLYLQQLLVLPGCAGNNRCWQFARQWRDAGHEVTFVSSDAYLPDDHPLKVKKGGVLHTELEGIELILLPVRYDHLMSFQRRVGSFLEFFRQAKRLIRKLNPADYDAVLAYSAPLSVGELGRWAAARMGKPLFFEVADVWPEVPIGMGIVRSKRMKHWLNHRTDAVYAAAQRVFPYSEGMAELIMARGVPAAKLLPIPNGADLASIEFVPRSSELHNPVEFIYTGTIGVANDLTQLMWAMHEVEQQHRADIRLTVVGQGNDARRVQALARRLDLRQVIFQPPVSREAATRLLDQADVGIVCFAPYPVLEANSATKFFDYLAAGLPILTNYQGWQARYLNQYRCGMAAPQDNLMALAQNILFLANSAERRAEFSRAGRQLAEDHFDRRKLAQEMLMGMLSA